MNQRHGIYKVVGRLRYRDHAPGETFVARLDPNAERRAVDRGAIVLLERVDPALDPARLRIPEGWLSP